MSADWCFGTRTPTLGDLNLYLYTHLFITVMVCKLEAVVCGWGGCGGDQVLTGGGDVGVGQDLEETHQVHHDGLLVGCLDIHI